VRAVERDGWDPQVWRALVDMGAFEFIGADAESDTLRAVEFSLVAEVLGRRLACVPFAESVAATQTLRSSTIPTQELISQREDDLVVLSPRPARGGVAYAVPGGAVAAAVIVLDEDQLVLLRGSAKEDVQDIGFTAAASWRTSAGENERTVLATGDEASRLWDVGLAWWRVGAAAASAGIAARALEVAVEYAKTREQFGVAIGSFQAVQHSLAEVLLVSEGAGHFVRETAWRADQGDGGWPALAAAAYAFAAEAATRSAEVCLHVHGGYGYTLDYDAQLFLRRATAIQLQGGDPDEIWTAVGAATMAGVI
jgi:alkylation response protein AidB-like acyl-CoA dehydrogenase